MRSDAKLVLHIRGLEFSQPDFDAIPRLVIGLVGNENTEIYICQDRDIFVFSPHFSPKIFAQIKEHFHARLEYDSATHPPALSFYDIESSGLPLIELVAAKLVKKEELRKIKAEKEAAERKAEQRTKFLNMPQDPTLTNTVTQRRCARSNLEIVVVEDDPFSRKLIDTALNEYTISFAEDGQTALTKYLQKAPDIVFLDIDLPDVSGHDVLTKILSFAPDAYIVMLSGNSQAENVKGAINSGAKGFVGKPFTKEKLLHYISKCPKSQFERIGD